MVTWLEQKEKSIHHQKYDEIVSIIQKILGNNISKKRLQQERAVKRKKYIDDTVYNAYQQVFLNQDFHLTYLKGHLSIQESPATPPRTPVTISIQYNHLRGIEYEQLRTIDFSQANILRVSWPHMPNKKTLYTPQDLPTLAFIKKFVNQSEDNLPKPDQRQKGKVLREIRKRKELATQHLQYDMQTSHLAQKLITTNKEANYVNTTNLVLILAANFIQNNYFLLKQEKNPFSEIKQMLMLKPAQTIFSEYREDILQQIRTDSRYNEFTIQY